MSQPPLRQSSPPPRLCPLWSGPLDSSGEDKPKSCARETQQVPPLPRMVFVCPIVGRLEDLTSTCVSTFHHAADTFGLNTNDVSSFAVPPVEPPLLAIEYQQRPYEGFYPTFALSVLETPALSFWEGSTPSIVTMAAKDSNGSPWRQDLCGNPRLVEM